MIYKEKMNSQTMIEFMKRLIRETGKKPADMFAKEKTSLQPLPVEPYDIGMVKQARASRQFRVTIDTNRYSVPAQLAGVALTVKLYLARNLKTIKALSKDQYSLFALDNTQYKNLLVINEVLRQQQWVHDHRENKIKDRIVSISQPHVRPIKRGKAGASTEFGAKISASLVDGYCFLDRLDWDNYNESVDLIDQIYSYKRRFGAYPSSVHVDKLYRNRNNIKFCKKHGIRISGPPLGRPPKDLSKRMASRKMARQDEVDRIPIEGKFGQAKRRFSLSKIMCKLSRTSETAIAVVFLVMNLEGWLKTGFLNFFVWFLDAFYAKKKDKHRDFQLERLHIFCG